MNNEKVITESAILKFYKYFSNRFKKSKVRFFKDPELNHEIKNHPLDVFLNSRNGKGN